MLMDRCTKVFKKTFLPAFRDCQSVKFHRHHVYLTQTTPPLSCHCLSSVVRHCHNSPTLVSCQKLEHRTLVRVCGSDVLGFLQGLVTNDVQLLETDSSAMYAMMLNFQGRILYDLILYRLKADEPTVLIECQRDVTSDLISSLLQYRLRKKISIADISTDFSVWSAFCESRDIPDLQITNSDTVLCISDPRHASLGHRLLLPSNVHEPTFSGCSVTFDGNYQSWRCQAGVGEGTIDFPPGQSFPLEANLDFMNGVSFSKGCYIGQELTARTNYTGVIRKRIMPLIISSPTKDIGPGAVIVNASGKECGKVRSVFGKRALGLLRIDDVVGKGKLEVRVDDSKVADAETYIPSWWPTSSDPVVQQAVTRHERALTKD